MNNTYQILLHWDKGQAFSERLSGKLLLIEGYEKVDPQSPMGGPDGKKDIVAFRHGGKHVIGCYFPNGQKSFRDISEKFIGDLHGVSKHEAQGFVFVTNQKITPSERINLSKDVPHPVEIFHGERVCGILDSPRGYGVRLEYLGIELTKEEQISFLDVHLNLKGEFTEIKAALDEIRKVTNSLGGHIQERDVEIHQPLTALPISGVEFSSRLSIEDLIALHRTILLESEQKGYSAQTGFRNVDVWIGKPGSSKEDADFLPISSSSVSREVVKLLKWWREEYITLKYGTESEKVHGIAEFHERILRIHPFLDGNGRLARAISSLQFRDLISKEVEFEKVEREVYYEALSKAISGDKSKLVDIFKALIKK